MTRFTALRHGFPNVEIYRRKDERENMREFMTKVSDYLNERRNDPDRQEDRIAIVIIGAVAVVVIVLLLMILWGHIVKERTQNKDKEKEPVATTYEEHAAEYMAPNDGQELLTQEYLTDMEYLNERIEELLATLTLVQENLSETEEQYQEGDSAIREEISSLHKEVRTIVQNLKETQTKLQDLYDIVQIMDEKTIPMIQAQITEIREDMNKVHTDISNLYTKIAALEQEDIKLWESIGNLEELLQTALNQNMAEVNNQLDIVINRMGNIENTIETIKNRMQRLNGQILRYRYDEGENTLYLEPYQE